MSKDSARPEISRYADYRCFLRDHYAWSKVRSPTLSYEALARRSDLSKTYLRNVLNGSRHITLDMVPKLTKAFRLDADERRYFTYLVCQGTSRNREMKKFFDFAIDRLRGDRLDTDRSPQPSPDNPSVFASGLAMVIHSLARQKGFRPEADWVLQRLPPNFASREVVSEILVGLRESRSIVQDESGGWQTSGFQYSRSVEVDPRGYRIYRRGLALTWQALDYAGEADPLSNHMMSLSFDEATYRIAVERLVEYRDALIQASRQVQDPTRVLFFSLNISGLANSAWATPT